MKNLQIIVLRKQTSSITSAAKDWSLSILHYLWGTKYLISDEDCLYWNSRCIIVGWNHLFLFLQNVTYKDCSAKSVFTRSLFLSEKLGHKLNKWYFHADNGFAKLMMPWRARNSISHTSNDYQLNVQAFCEYIKTPYI